MMNDIIIEREKIAAATETSPERWRAFIRHPQDPHTIAVHAVADTLWEAVDSVRVQWYSTEWTRSPNGRKQA